MLQSMGLQRVGHDLAAEQRQQPKSKEMLFYSSASPPSQVTSDVHIRGYWLTGGLGTRRPGDPSLHSLAGSAMVRGLPSESHRWPGGHSQHC